MGKANVIRHIGEGQYSIEILYDMRRIGAEKNRLEKRIVALENDLAEIIEEENDCLTEDSPIDEEEDLIEDVEDEEDLIEEDPEEDADPPGPDEEVVTILGTVTGE